ncbi:MAG TPA: HNH endonuclease [Nitrospirota bacterium]|nr:HNH endonuclease [Nitrospirota bacterium]
MKFWVGVTDNNWYKFLAQLKPDEVNFWQPGGSQVFHAVDQFAPFLFKLHYPENYIAGGGFFVRQSFLPLSFAWETFGQKNGTPDYETLRRKIIAKRKESTSDPTIGCILLAQPFFLSREEWIPAPEDFSKNIVQGKTYDMSGKIGAHLWRQVRERLDRDNIVPTEQIGEEQNRYGAPFQYYPRIGQDIFRVMVTEAYGRRCAISGEKTLPVLQAAHIKPYSELGPHRIENGLLLRADMHILFDKGYLTVTPDYHTEVSRQIEVNFHNGKEYYKFHGRRLEVLPTQQKDRPSEAFLRWHNEKKFIP